MLIVLTQDESIIAWANNNDSGASQWGTVNVVNEGGAPAASVKIKSFLKNVGKNESLCVTGHGTDDEIGDEELSGPRSWFWTVDDFARYLGSSLPAGYAGPILIEACADTRNNFSQQLARTLGEQGNLNGVWVYGYDKGVAVTHPFPNPKQLGKNNELTKDRVAVKLGEVSMLANPQGNDETTPKPWPPTPLTKPNPGLAKYNQPAEKYYVVNETGNIMLATTQPKITAVDPAEQSLFEQVAVFFAAMTKAITSTLRPGAKPPYKPSDYYSIYDYVPLENIVNRSGLFVNVHREDLTYTKTKDTLTINIEFIEEVLGVVLTDGVGAGALMASMTAMGKQATFSYSSTGKHQKIANILFLCEYLFGMPIVSVLYFYLDEDMVETVVKFSPCVTVSTAHYDINIHKDTFMFVPPSWIEKYAGGLSSVAAEADYRQLVTELEGYISNTPVVLSVQDGSKSVTQLKDGSAYTLEGANLGATQGTLTIAGTPQTVAKKSDWTEQTVSFTAKKPTGGTATGGPIVLQTAGSSPMVAVSAQNYEFTNS